MPKSSPKPRSPRAPSIGLPEAIQKACVLYDKEGKHAAAADIAAKHLGYSGALNGSAARTLASLNFFGLVERGRTGYIAVAKSLEDFLLSPNPKQKAEIAKQWLESPDVYLALLTKYPASLPSSPTLVYELVQMGFLRSAAEECEKNFRASVEYVKGISNEAHYIEAPSNKPPAGTSDELHKQKAPDYNNQQPFFSDPSLIRENNTVDRIPIRLPKARKAWIEIPTPFYSADKEIIKRAIDAIIADDED
jgi:hypothetical protein